MFNTTKKLTIREKIDSRKRWLQQFESEVRELALGPCTAQMRENALLLHTKTHILYSKLERLEDTVSHFVDDVDDLLNESREVSLVFQGDFFLLKYFSKRGWDIEP